ncbi:MULTISPECIES: hypothetical protein [unclassified Paenibacillus]|uniref:hypothetical protein n=1 Tax=unclassified Paenibacillus TaxID=185978 RepID=UPI00070F0B59|nr:MULTISPECIES: hypothetical protein [unclassified Paenibacillus]KQX47081.1 hypothetical protein ASD40_17615 [Paenibacillus sp. Root444D2]KRE48221.1 hypothetical protein ASG85_04235 [Paenibacillus sp. Soil724D2]
MQSEGILQEEQKVTSLCGNHVARLVPSSDGPKLMINREEYALNEACWDVEMFHGRNNSILIFYWKGEVKLSVKMPPMSQIEAFLTRLYQCLSTKLRTVQPI